MQHRVIKPHKPSSRDILTVRRGDVLRFERRPSEWPGWLYCTNADGKSGWAPESWVIISGDTCRFERDYDSTELLVEAGDMVTIELEEAGWAWVRKLNGEHGWVPRDCLGKL